MSESKNVHSIWKQLLPPQKWLRPVWHLRCLRFVQRQCMMGVGSHIFSSSPNSLFWLIWQPKGTQDLTIADVASTEWLRLVLHLHMSQICTKTMFAGCWKSHFLSSSLYTHYFGSLDTKKHLWIYVQRQCLKPVGSHFFLQQQVWPKKWMRLVLPCLVHDLTKWWTLEVTPPPLISIYSLLWLIWQPIASETWKTAVMSDWNLFDGCQESFLSSYLYGFSVSGSSSNRTVSL